MLKKMKVKLIGVCPLIMHNGQLADPLNEHAKALKEVTSKRSKTDEDQLHMSRIEFMGGLYVDEDGKYIVPEDVIEGVIVDGAKKSRAGKIATAGVFCDGDFKLTKYEGPKDPETRFNEGHFLRKAVRVQSARVMRTRPKFNNWEATGTIVYDDEQLNKADVQTWLMVAGRQSGIMDHRPRYGRFDVEFK
jgi:hypothetical protein